MKKEIKLRVCFIIVSVILMLICCNKVNANMVPDGKKGSFYEVATEVHKYCRENNYKYTVGIGIPIDAPDSNKGVDCSAYICQCLYECGFIEEGPQLSNVTLVQFCKEKFDLIYSKENSGSESYVDVNKLKSGDIVITDNYADSYIIDEIKNGSYTQLSCSADFLICENEKNGTLTNEENIKKVSYVFRVSNYNGNTGSNSENTNGGGTTGENQNDTQNETITFKDKNLFKAIVVIIQEKIKAKDDSKGTIEITKEDLDSITNLELESKGIKDISGLEKFTNLEKINLSNNNISDFSTLSKMTKLSAINSNIGKQTLSIEGGKQITLPSIVSQAFSVYGATNLVLENATVSSDYKTATVSDETKDSKISIKGGLIDGTVIEISKSATAAPEQKPSNNDNDNKNPSAKENTNVGTSSSKLPETGIKSVAIFIGMFTVVSIIIRKKLKW